MRAGAYIRVSKTREGGQSAEEQRSAIQARAESDGATIVREVVEQDVSGGKSARLRRLEELVQAAEAGELSTIYVLDFSRLTREHPYRAMEPLARLLDVKGRVVGLLDGFDSSTAMGAQVAALLAGQAYQYRETMRQRWDNAKQRSIRDGIAVGRAPVGYRRNPNTRKLVPDPKTAPAIREAFRLRAAGASIREVGDFLEARGVRSSSGAERWQWQSVRDLLSRRVYLGEVKLGEWRNAEAHEPLIDLPLWQAAQMPPSQPRRPRSGSGLLVGLLRCASCGYSMSSTTRADSVRIYRCIGGRRGGKCPAPAAIRADRAEEEATDWFYTVSRAFQIVRPRHEAPDLSALQEALTTAQRRLAQAQAPEVQDALGHDEWVTMLQERKQAVELAAEALGRAEVAAEGQDAGRPDVATLRDEFEPAPVEQKREMLGLLFDMFAITREKEMLVYLWSTAPDDLPRQGKPSNGLHPLGGEAYEWAAGVLAAAVRQIEEEDARSEDRPQRLPAGG